MDRFSRKAIFGVAAVITTATMLFMTMGTAGATTAAPTAPAARSVHAAPAAHEVSEALVWPLTVQGNTGERVFAIQSLLNQQIGAGLATDSIFGPLTAAAVRNFQSRRGLLVDGKVGNQTWPALIIQVQRGSTGSAVRAVQHSLRFSYGFTTLAVDGIFGPLTQAAVRSFQARFKIGVDGIVGPITWNTLVVHEG
ncbi:MAG TPA: peptidoglycan-binding protein [Streptosporangiaceae bacterium]|jgi:peptidoglycan hydrolase-like protein with peptidoglycan-binding domain